MKKHILLIVCLLIAVPLTQGYVDNGIIKYCTNLIESNVIDISEYQNVEKEENPMTNLWIWLKKNIKDYKYEDVTSMYFENNLGRTWIYENKTHLVYDLENKLFIRNKQDIIIHYVDKLIIDKLNKSVIGICCKDRRKKKSYNIDYKHVKGRESLLIWLKRFKEKTPLRIIPDNKMVNHRETELWVFFNNSKEYRFYLDKYYRLPIQVEIDNGINPTKYYKYRKIQVNMFWQNS